MDSLAEGLVPALIGLFNAFLIIGIIVSVLYLYRRLVVEKAEAPVAGVAGAMLEEEPKKEKPEVVEEPRETSAVSHEEVAVAVAAVRHHIRLTSLARPTAAAAGSQAFVSAWLSSWLGEVTQSWDYNPYILERRGVREG